MHGFTPDTLTLAACRSLHLDVSARCDRCNTLRQWVGARTSRHDDRPIAELWGAGLFTCARCGDGRPLASLEVRMRGNTLRDGELLARWDHVANVEGVFPVGQQVEPGGAVLRIALPRP